jgi:hypothetical protein
MLMRWRFTARRTTETLVAECDDTEDLPWTGRPAAGSWDKPMHHWRVVREPPPPLPPQHPLDTTRPWPATEPAPIFWHLVKHPPVTAPWRSRLGFTVDETARATGDESFRWHVLSECPDEQSCPIHGRNEPPVLDPLPPVPYPPLAEDTLAGEFAAGYLP